MTPEQFHVAVTHLPIIGLGLAVIPILFGILGRNRAALVAGLLIAAITGWSTILVVKSGESAFQRYAEARHYGITLDGGAQDWMAVHEKDAHTLAKVMYFAAGVATLALFLSLVNTGVAVVLSWIVVFLCLASVGVGLILADSGNKIRRADFRVESCPGHSTEVFPETVHGDFHIFS